MYVRVYVGVYVCVCMCICVSVCEHLQMGRRALLQYINFGGLASLASPLSLSQLLAYKMLQSCKQSIIELNRLFAVAS